MDQSSPSKKRVLIVGGGFGGLRAARALSKRDDFAVTLLSDKDMFRYYPTLFKTVTGGLYSQSNIPLTNIVDTARVKIVRGTAQK